jgi:uroporphyrinogen decarboxylase
MNRRQFLFSTAAASLGAFRPRGAKGAELTSIERVDRALEGRAVDRPPFSFWHHFGLKTPEEHAQRTLQFHQLYKTDIVKVMSDFPFPKPASGKWYELKVVNDPFPQQIKALELIRNGLGGKAYFMETVFNSWNVAEKLSSKEEVRKLAQTNPTALLHALDVIADSQILHAERAFKAGASGILFSVANANEEEMPLADYVKFSRPSDKKFMAGIVGQKLNTLHLHVKPAYLDQFHDFTFEILNYSDRVSGIPFKTVRGQYPSPVLAGGINEVDYKTLSADQIRAQWKAAADAAGPKFILTPGCSVPNDSSPVELARLPNVLGIKTA